MAIKSVDNKMIYIIGLVAAIAFIGTIFLLLSSKSNTGLAITRTAISDAPTGEKKLAVCACLDGNCGSGGEGCSLICKNYNGVNYISCSAPAGGTCDPDANKCSYQD